MEKDLQLYLDFLKKWDIKMERKKELKEKYKQMKPEMGIFLIKEKKSGKYHIEGTQNLKGKMNGMLFQLKMGNNSNKKLQEDWKLKGEENFTVEVLERLEYEDDETKIDYSQELEIMKLIWQEKLPGKEY